MGFSGTGVSRSAWHTVTKHTCARSPRPKIFHQAPISIGKSLPRSRCPRGYASCPALAFGNCHPLIHCPIHWHSRHKSLRTRDET